jgi:hypothetical protein
MRKILETEVGKPKTEAVKSTKDYFLNQGFKLEHDTGSRLTFSRGSTLSNMVTFNPLKWKSKIVIDFTATGLVALFDINTAGQVVTPKEEKLWDGFIENYKQTLNNDFDYSTANQILQKDTKRNSLKYVGYAAVGGLLAGIPAGFVAYWTGIDEIVGMAAAGGAIAMVTYQVEKEKKKVE